MYICISYLSAGSCDSTIFISVLSSVVSLTLMDKGAKYSKI